MTESTLLYFHCLTGLHPGSGTALGVVDLPVQRERHTDWPLIPGSSIKGVLRNACASERGRRDSTVLAAFGPEPGTSASEHAGALSFSDARLLAFPVRSLKGVFAWTTCPSVLNRMKRDWGVTGQRGFPTVPEVPANGLVCAADSPLLTSERAVLEEFEFKREDLGDAAETLADWLARNVSVDQGTQRRFRSHLAILSDNDFTHFVRYATDVVARIGLDYERKTVRDGALFYEEYLPAESLFYSIVMADHSRRKGVSMQALDVLSWLKDTIPGYTMIGGGESVGKGLCALRFGTTDREVTS